MDARPVQIGIWGVLLLWKCEAPRVELVRRGAPAMSHEALEAEEIGPRGDRLHVVCSLPLAALRAVAPAMSEPPRAERA